MQKYLLLLTLLSFPLVAMYSEISTEDETEEAPTRKELPTKPTIVKKEFYAKGQWHEIEVQLSNGETLTYTKFPRLNNSSACIHAIPVNNTHERRINASDYWHQQMEQIYLEKTRRSIVTI